jgi:hypothetical protein
LSVVSCQLSVASGRLSVKPSALSEGGMFHPTRKNIDFVETLTKP